MIILWILIPLLIIALINSIVRVKQDHRGAVFTLGRFKKVIGPGLHVHYPYIELVKTVDLNADLKGWQTYSPKELETKVKEFVLGPSGVMGPSSVNRSKAGSPVKNSGDTPSSPEAKKLSSSLIKIICSELEVDLTNDQAANLRITDAAKRAIEEIKAEGHCTINLPFITADAEGPKHFTAEIDSAKLKELTSN